MRPIGLKPQPHRTEIRENGRVCTKCLVFKEWDCFSRLLTANTGHTSSCRDCNKGTRKRS